MDKQEQSNPRLHMEYRGDVSQWIVVLDGRDIFASQSHYQASMFLAELLVRIALADGRLDN